MAREYKTRISQAIEAFAAERQDRGFCAADVKAADRILREVCKIDKTGHVW